MYFKSKTHDYILLVVIMALTGFMSFFGLHSGVYYLMPYILLVFIGRRCSFSRQSKWVLGGLAALLIIQLIIHHGAPINTIGLFLRLLLMSMCAIILAPRFSDTFPKVMYVICLVSLSFWIITNFSPPLRSFLINIAQSFPELRSEEFLNRTTNVSYSLYIYTIPISDSLRNSGPFWEPGMFTVFITIALAISLFNGERLLSKHVIIFFITNLTTMSTSGYVAMMILFSGYVIFGTKHTWLKFFFPLILLFFLPSVLSLDFMQDKITTQMGDTDIAWSRFGAMYYHWEKIQLAPLTGYGINELPFTASDSLYRSLDTVNSPNGITYVAVLFGIPAALLYFIFIYSSTRWMIVNSTKQKQIVLFLVILALAFSQDITGRLFFFMLLFMGVECFTLKTYGKYNYQ